MIPAQGMGAELAKDQSDWLSIGIPAYLQDDGADKAGDSHSLITPTYEIDRFSVRGGRINPSFGLAWDKAMGFYGTNMATDPGSSGLLSLSAGLKFDPPGWGSHTLSGRTFVYDGATQRNSFVIRDRDTADRHLDGSDNGDLPTSFNLVLEGSKLPVLPDLTYHLALINQPKAGTVAEKETGFAAGLTTKFDLGQGLSISPMFEAARLNDPVGQKNRESQYWSTSMLTEWRNWNLGLTYAQRDAEDPLASAISGYRAQASIGYVFDFGLSADLGWYRLKDEEDSTDQFGFRFTYPLRLGR